jgi:hypothetical protein
MDRVDIVAPNIDEDPESAVIDVLLSSLRASSKEQIINQVLAKYPAWNRGMIKSAIARLVSVGSIAKIGNDYVLSG